jgi:hypothetical protein
VWPSGTKVEVDEVTTCVFALEGLTLVLVPYENESQYW